MVDKEYIVILHGLYTDCSLICVKPCKGKKRLSAVAGSLLDCDFRDNHSFKFCLNSSNIISLWLSVWALSYFCWNSSRIAEVFFFHFSYSRVCSGALNPLFLVVYHLFLFFSEFIYAFWIGDCLALYFFAPQSAGRSCWLH